MSSSISRLTESYYPVERLKSGPHDEAQCGVMIVVDQLGRKLCRTFFGVVGLSPKDIEVTHVTSIELFCNTKVAANQGTAKC